MVLLVAKSLVDWSWGDTWVVTGLGFGIVVVLLICLVFILQAFGWTMQRMTAPKAPKAPEAPKQTPKTESTQKAAQKAQTAPSEPEKAAIAMAIAASDSDEIAAVAYALHLAHNSRHDLPTAMISLHPHETA
jgi:Na+-transporting methylmalonyl-CoA/oxaloacetate decarboxylase gamma subunit